MDQQARQDAQLRQEAETRRLEEARQAAEQVKELSRTIETPETSAFFNVPQSLSRDPLADQIRSFEPDRSNSEIPRPPEAPVEPPHPTVERNFYDPLMKNIQAGVWINLDSNAEGMRSPDGVVHIRSVVGEGTERGGFERLLLPGVEVGLPGYDRAHSLPPQFGQESAAGLLYAPSAVNQILQNHILEADIRQLRDQASGRCQVVLKTETESQSNSLLLGRITYRVEMHPIGVDPFKSTPIAFREAEIRIEGPLDNPRITFDDWASPDKI